MESTELVKILRPLIPQYGHIAAVAQPNIVIVSDHADNILRLMRIIEQIDVSEEDQIVVVPLKEAWVETVVELLEKLAPSQIGANATGPQSIQLIANKRNNSLVVRGKPRPVAEILKIIDLIDQPATATGGVRVVYLKHADAAAVAEVLKGTLDQQSPNSEELAATIQPDESLNAVIIRASPSAMSEILDIWSNSTSGEPRCSSKPPWWKCGSPTSARSARRPPSRMPRAPLHPWLAPPWTA